MSSSTKRKRKLEITIMSMPDSRDENGFYISWRQGVATFWRSQKIHQIKFPHNRPMFSERYGYQKPRFKFFGFRYFIIQREEANKSKLRLVKK